MIDFPLFGSWYSKDEDQYILDNSHMSDDDLAIALGRTALGVSRRRQRLQSLRTKAGKRWETDEDKWLVDDTKTDEELSSLLNRTISAITSRRRYLGLRK